MAVRREVSVRLAALLVQEVSGAALRISKSGVVAPYVKPYAEALCSCHVKGVPFQDAILAVCVDCLAINSVTKGPMSTYAFFRQQVVRGHAAAPT